MEAEIGVLGDVTTGAEMPALPRHHHHPQL
jgi:hypothetical protein